LRRETTADAGTEEPLFSEVKRLIFLYL